MYCKYKCFRWLLSSSSPHCPWTPVYPSPQLDSSIPAVLSVHLRVCWEWRRISSLLLSCSCLSAAGAVSWQHNSLVHDMYVFLVAPLLLAQCKVAGVNLVGQRSVHFPFTSIIADRRLLDACMGVRESREDARETKRKVWMENRERTTKGREGEIAVRWTANWVRKKGKGDGVTQMIDGRMLRQNKVSDRHGEERRRQEDGHMLLVTCPIIKNLIYWQASTLSLIFYLTCP